jgi:hypothetical protein
MFMDIRPYHIPPTGSIPLAAAECLIHRCREVWPAEWPLHVLSLPSHTYYVVHGNGYHYCAGHTWVDDGFGNLYPTLAFWISGHASNADSWADFYFDPSELPNSYLVFNS